MKMKAVMSIMVIVSFISSVLLSYVFHNPWFFLILLTLLPLLIRQKFSLYLEMLLLIIFLSVTLKLMVSVFFKTGDHKHLFLEIGSLSFYAGYLLYALQAVYSKKFKESFTQKIEREAGDPGWTCTKCKSEVLHSAACWNCQTPKPGTFQTSGALEKEVSPEENKLDSYLQKQKEEAEKKNGQV
jgi:hypothetical protein